MPRQSSLKDLKPLPPKRNLGKAMFKNLCEEALKKGEKTMYARCVRATLWVRMRAVLLALVVTPSFGCGVPLSDIFRIIKDDDALEKQFKSWDTDGSGCIDRKELKEALQKLGDGHTEAEIKELFDDADQNHDGKISFEEFRKAVNTPCAAEQWAANIPFAKLFALFVPPSPKGDEDSNPLASLVALAREKDVGAAVDKIITDMKPYIKTMMMEMLDEFKRSVETALAAKNSSGDRAAKFGFLQLESGIHTGTIRDFMHGLAGRIGLPNADLDKGMEDEHLRMPNSTTKFVASNYGLETTAKQEWEIVDTGGYVKSCSKEYIERSKACGRVIRKLSELMELREAKPVNGEHKLSTAEVRAVALYTGPNYMLYNAAMRQGASCQVYQSLQGNKFPNTIHALVSAVLKLQRKNVEMPENLILYRGLGRAVLPPEFYGSVKEPGVKGLTEFGFMSSTRVKAVATHYSKVAEGNPLATVLSMQCGAVDRAAPITMFSQFPAEEEWLWTPMCYVEPEPEEKQSMDMTKDGVVKVIPVRVNTNLKAKTVEEILGERCHLLQTSLKYHQRHLDSELHLVLQGKTTASMVFVREGDIDRKKAKSKEGLVEEAAKDILDRFVFETRVYRTEDIPKDIIKKFTTETETKRTKRDVGWFNDDNNYRAAIDEILELKLAAFLTFEDFVTSEQATSVVLKSELRKSAHKYRTGLEKRMRNSKTSVERKRVAMHLLKAQGFGFAPDGAPLRGIHPIHLCACAANGEVLEVELLVQAELFDVNAVNAEGSSALMTAAEYGRDQCLELLIHHNADVDKFRDTDQVTALFLAAKGGHAGCVRVLHERGDPRNVLRCADYKHHALSAAVQHGFVDCVRVLCQGNSHAPPLTRAEVDTPGAAGYTALCWAIKNRHLQCIDVLVEAKCSVDLKLANGHTALSLSLGEWWKDCPATQLEKRREVVMKLIEMGADVNLFGGKMPTKLSELGNTDPIAPLMLACVQGSVECVHKLLGAGADPLAKTAKGYIALHFAAKHSAKECVDLLLALESATAQACSKSKDSKYPHSLADDTGIGTQLKAFYDEEQKRLAEDAKKLKEGKKI
eukprot:Tamp_03763.p1 GENE.Tamp_03763~~Tamp_03763.p1  ORF type:complete len:1127 (-),score=261.01 Tamp_03763:195-3440(-)